jgi:hypothetical protein
MQRIPTLAVLSLSALLSAPAMRAQGVVLKANIPFQFTVSKTTMPPGDYTLSSPLSGVVRIENSSTHEAATLATSRNFNEGRGRNSLVFERYGNRYYLHQVRCSTTVSLNVSVAGWRSEEVRRSKEVGRASGEQVLVALN